MTRQRGFPEISNSIAALRDEIETLEDAIKSLDEMIEEANEDYAEPMTKDSAAKEVIMLTKKSEKSNGVTAMMDMMLKDLDEGKTTVTATKKDAQADCESS